MEKKSMVSTTQVVNGKEKIHEVKEDLIMLVRTSTGPVELLGPKADLMKFRDQLKDKENRHKFLECPPHLLTWAPWLVGVSILPADVGMIVIQIPSLTPKQKPGLFLPGLPKGGLKKMN